MGRPPAFADDDDEDEDDKFLSSLLKGKDGGPGGKGGADDDEEDAEEEDDWLAALLKDDEDDEKDGESGKDDEGDDWLAALLKDDEDGEDGEEEEKGGPEDEDGQPSGAADEDDEDAWLAELLEDDEDDEDDEDGGDGKARGDEADDAGDREVDEGDAVREAEDGADAEDEDAWLSELIEDDEDEARGDADDDELPALPGDGEDECEPGLVAPAEPETRRPVPHRSRATRPALPGDLVCPECGENNDEERKFCSRCGSSLEQAEEATLPWWPRFCARLRPGPTVLAAGQRPGQAGVRDKRRFAPSALLGPTRLIGSVALFTLVTLYMVHPPFRTYVTTEAREVQTRLKATVKPEFEPVNPVHVEDDSSGDPAHSGSLAFDNWSDTFWLSKAEGDQGVKLTFAEPVDLTHLVVRNGAFPDFKAYDRAKELEISYSNGQTQKVTLQDKSEEQSVELDARGKADWIKVRVVGAYGTRPGNMVALSELEFNTTVRGYLF
ncbi:zinc-ribbon domain-containing protein [Streptomyces bambusae]|nr:zinc-ribbon domain-containing protein [Streptomyces bambusae]